MYAQYVYLYSANSILYVLVVNPSLSLCPKSRLLFNNKIIVYFSVYVAHRGVVIEMRCLTTVLFGVLLPMLMTAKKLIGSTVLGVDIGGNFMKAAYVAPGEEDPFPILLSDLSERKSAYAVAFRKGKWLTGTHATKAAISNPNSTFLYLGSHLLGRSFSSPEVDYYKSIFTPSLKEDELRKTVLVEDANGKSVPVEFLTSIYLDNLKDHTENVSNRHMAGAVVTVPSYYDQVQRKAFLDAAELANFKIYALIHPASAGKVFLDHYFILDFFVAAIYYGTQVFNGAEPQNVIIFDSGATGTSAVVAHIDPNYKANASAKPMVSIEIKAVVSDTRLSGHQIDFRLTSILKEKFESANPTVKVAIGKSFNRLMNEAIRVKHVLSANTEITTGVEDLVDEISFNSRVTREELEASCSDMNESIRKVVDEALILAKLGLKDISSVIPVGGNSRVPFVLGTLKQVVGEAKVFQTLNAEEAAAKGATLYAAALHATFRLKPFKFKDASSTGLKMEYDMSEGLKTVEVYSAGLCHLESHKGVSLRNVDNVDITFSQLPLNNPLFKLSVNDFQKSFAQYEKVLDSKLKIFIDIDRSGMFQIEPPTALVQYEKLVVPDEPKTTTSTSAPATDTATTTTSPESSTTPPIAPTTVEPVLKKFTESIALPYKLDSLLSNIPENIISECKAEISKYRVNLELQLQRAHARNDLESTYYNLRSEIDYESFYRWYTVDELETLKKELSSCSTLIDEDRPEHAKEDYLAALNRITEAQASANTRKKETELRSTVVPEVQKTINDAVSYANNTLHVFEPEKRAQTNEELESLLTDADAFEKELIQKLELQATLPDNADPAFKCSELSSRAELLKLTMKMLKRKVLPKPTPTASPTPTPAPETANQTEPTSKEEKEAEIKEHGEL